MGLLTCAPPKARHRMVVRYVDHVNPSTQPLQLVTRAEPAQGSNARQQGKQGREVYLLANGGHEDELYQLLETGGCGRWRHPSHGATALYIACATGHAGCVRLLLQAGSDANCETKAGRTALVAAIVGGHAECVSVLLEGGADPTRKGSDNRTPEQIAFIEGSKAAKCLQLLQSWTRALQDHPREGSDLDDGSDDAALESLASRSSSMSPSGGRQEFCFAEQPPHLEI